MDIIIGLNTIINNIISFRSIIYKLFLYNIKTNYFLPYLDK